MSNSPFDELQPELIWKHFEAITKIPRCSRHEEAMGQHVMRWAESKGFSATKDKLGNLVVRVPGSPGKEGSPTVVLQGHLDMVCEKNSDSPVDFSTDAIPVMRKGDYLTADGTTLGADNGIGLAAAMAVAEDPGAVRGPLELLFTMDEETGLTGAQGLEDGFITGKTLLNLDSEEEGAVYVGCAGGADTGCTIPLTREAAEGEAMRVHVFGLRGGHSGLDINTGRANALQLLAWYLDALREKTDFALVDFHGGDKHNAIPREAWATLLVDAEGKAAATALLERFLVDLRTAYGLMEDQGEVILEASKGGLPLSRASRDTILDLMLALPHGVLGMSQSVEGLVETSTNLAVLKMTETAAEIQESTRSSVMPALDLQQRAVFAAFRLAGGEPKSHGGYPGWQPDLASNVLNKATAVHARLFGKEPDVKAIHAGLECGIIGEKMGGMDMLSFGPQIEHPHSPDERIKISSVAPFYTFLKELLVELA